MLYLLRFIRYIIDSLGFKRRRTFKALLDFIAITLAYYLSYLVRFEWQIPMIYQQLMWISYPFLLFTTILLYFLFGAYSDFWIYWSYRDLKRLLILHTSTVLFLGGLNMIIKGFPRIPLSIFLIYWFFATLLFSSLRVLCRTILELQQYGSGKRKRLMIIGAGQSGEMLIRQIKTNPDVHYKVVGMIDDDPDMLGRAIHGIRILGDRSGIAEISRSKRVDEIIISIPSANSLEMQEIVQECEKSGVPFWTVPGIKELVNGRVTLDRVRKVRIEDLLGRDQSEMDHNRVHSFIHNKTILVTGAAGSIGSELCRQIQAFNPKNLIMVDHNENGLFFLQNEMENQCPVEPIVMNILNRNKMKWIINRFKPAIIFHAAAYKHVPCMEVNPTEAIMNNLESTVILANLAIKASVEKFVLISTDKAVNPTTVMGASKRLCELYCQYLSAIGHKDIISVRFGNVIGSQGSVFQVFRDQLIKGKAITLTHPDMERYFMSILEACKLVLEASASGKCGCTFVLDMGTPIRIIDMAEHMISLAGYIPYKDIPIKIVGLRPGEKLKEELWYSFEKPENTQNPKVFVAQTKRTMAPEFNNKIAEIIQLARSLKTENMMHKIIEMIPEYEPKALYTEPYQLNNETNK